MEGFQIHFIFLSMLLQELFVRDKCQQICSKRNLNMRQSRDDAVGKTLKICIVCL